jgi:hypothetical protein
MRQDLMAFFPEDLPLQFVPVRWWIPPTSNNEKLVEGGIRQMEGLAPCERKAELVCVADGRSNKKGFGVWAVGA